jgi:hypothetical protein
LTLRDESVYGNHGTLTNMDAATDWVVSGGKGALDFDGTDDYVTTPNIAWPSSAFTLSLYGRFRSPSDAEVSASSYNDTGAYFQLFQSGATFVFRVHQSKDVIFIGRSGGAPTNSWSNLVLVWNGGTSSSAIQIWQNGSRVDSTDNSSGTFSAPYSTPIPLYIGTQIFSFVPNNPSDSQLDDIRIYNRALAPYEIKLLALRRGIAFERASRKLAVSSAPAPTGSVSSTLANASLSSSGTLASGLSGTVSAVLADASLSSTGTLASGSSGTVTSTLDAATLASTVTVGSGVTATVSVTLAAATLSSSGTLAAGLSGSTNSTLANATLSSSGTVAAGASGTVTRTLDNATLSATGGAAGSVTGSVSATLAAVA